jgi:hypothetical protein
MMKRRGKGRKEGRNERDKMEGRGKEGRNLKMERRIGLYRRRERGWREGERKEGGKGGGGGGGSGGGNNRNKM